jgi:hypothetical protein
LHTCWNILDLETMLDMLLNFEESQERPLTSDDADMVMIEEDELTPRPKKKKSQISDWEDELGEDEPFQTPPTLKKTKVPGLSFVGSQDSSLSEMSDSEDLEDVEDGTDKKEKHSMTVKGKGAHKQKVTIKDLQASFTY